MNRPIRLGLPVLAILIASGPILLADDTTNLVKNPGFEEPSGSASRPADFVLEGDAVRRFAGTAYRVLVDGRRPRLRHATAMATASARARSRRTSPSTSSLPGPLVSGSRSAGFPKNGSRRPAATCTSRPTSSPTRASSRSTASPARFTADRAGAEGPGCQWRPPSRRGGDLEDLRVRVPPAIPRDRHGPAQRRIPGRQRDGPIGVLLRRRRLARADPDALDAPAANDPPGRPDRRQTGGSRRPRRPMVLPARAPARLSSRRAEDWSSPRERRTPRLQGWRPLLEPVRGKHVGLAQEGISRPVGQPRRGRPVPAGQRDDPLRRHVDDRPRPQLAEPPHGHVPQPARVRRPEPDLYSRTRLHVLSPTQARAQPRRPGDGPRRTPTGPCRWVRSASPSTAWSSSTRSTTACPTPPT